MIVSVIHLTTSPGSQMHKMSKKKSHRWVPDVSFWTQLNHLPVGLICRSQVTQVCRFWWFHFIFLVSLSLSFLLQRSLGVNPSSWIQGRCMLRLVCFTAVLPHVIMQRFFRVSGHLSLIIYEIAFVCMSTPESCNLRPVTWCMKMSGKVHQWVVSLCPILDTNICFRPRATMSQMAFPS